MSQLYDFDTVGVPPLAGGRSPVTSRSEGGTALLDPLVTAGAYSAGDVVGGLLRVANIIPADMSGLGTLLIQACQLEWEAVANPGWSAFLFDEQPAVTLADNDPFSLSAVDLRKLAARLEFVGGQGVGANGYSNRLSVVAQAVRPVARDLWAYFQITGVGMTLTSTAGFRAKLTAILL